MSSWYDTGFAGLKKEEDRMASSTMPNDFWISAGGEATIVFVDDEPLCLHEHEFGKDGKWGQKLTCLQGLGPRTPCCDILGDKSRVYAGYLTVLDCTRVVGKTGKEYQYEVKLFRAKYKTLATLKRKKEKRGSLVGCLVTVARDEGMSPRVGNEFDFGEDVKDPAKMFAVANYRGKRLVELWDKADADAEYRERLARTFKLEVDEKTNKLVRRIVPFNYFELLKPKSPDDVKRLLSGGGISTSSYDDRKGEGEGGKGGVDESVPF